jgi:hypothetical protein
LVSAAGGANRGGVAPRRRGRIAVAALTAAWALAAGSAGTVLAAASEGAAPSAAGMAPTQASVDNAVAPEVRRYRVQMPPALTLHYDVRHGFLRGTGDLNWRPQGERYELTLVARVGALTILTQTSSGAVDAGGIAPLRYADQRLGRAPTAATFQRQARIISFSDRPTQFELHDGTQDRLSWMIQLAGIVGADPLLSKAGARVAMYVVGTHGDLDVWAFRCVGDEVVSVADVAQTAVKFVRETRHSDDTAVQVWLDPRRFHVPLRATQRSGRDDDGFELQLREVAGAN